MPRHYAVLMRQCWDGAMDTRPTMDTVRTELEALMVESVINDQKGRDFWKRHFGGDPKSVWDSAMFIYLFVCPFIYPFACSFIHSFSY